MTTTPTRPSLSRAHTRSSEAKRDEALDTGARITIEGEAFEARIGDVTPSIARELRRATGGGFMSLLSTMADDPDVDVVSAFVWVARRIRGEAIALDDVNVTYAQMLADGFDVQEAGAEIVEADDPQT